MTSAIRGPFRAAVAAIPPGGLPKAPADFPGPVRMRPLHLNECPYPPSPAVVAAVAAAARDGNRYPDASVRRLSAALAERTGIAPERIVFGTGSEELIQLCATITLDAGDVAVMPAPSFGKYVRSTQIMDALPQQVALHEDGRNDITALVAAAREPGVRLLLMATPNNPTGAMNDAAELAELARTAPDDVLLVVDEAYHEFAHVAGGPDVLDALRLRRGPWVVLRTFSKAYCLAGLRLGYALCSDDSVSAALAACRGTFNANLLAQAAGLAALEDEAHLAMVLKGCATERQRLAYAFIEHQQPALPSVANYLSVKTRRPPIEIASGFADRGILIGIWSDPGRGDHIRISIGLADDTDAVIAALPEVL